jgi:uroporphyrinogen-III synthase
VRIVSFESRRASEMRGLIERHGGTCVSAPSMREVPVELDEEARTVAGRILDEDVDLLIFLTGVGCRALREAVETAGLATGDAWVEALRHTRIAVRGPKPIAVLKEWGVPYAVAAPEPNTWKELLEVVAADLGAELAGAVIALQEYGIPNPRLVSALQERGAEVLPIRVYAWAPPEDPAPLAEALREIAAGGIDAVTFTSGNQVHAVLAAARSLGIESELRAALGRVVVASIGPVCSEQLREVGIEPTFEPAHPKMGHLVKELLARS